MHRSQLERSSSFIGFARYLSLVENIDILEPETSLLTIVADLSSLSLTPSSRPRSRSLSLSLSSAFADFGACPSLHKDSDKFKIVRIFKPDDEAANIQINPDSR